MNKDELLAELEKKFNKTKEDLEFKSSFEDIDSIFFIKDAILKDGYVSEEFSRQLCHRMMDTFMSWINYLHSLIFPNPGYLINAAEAKIFDEEERRNMNKLISKAMSLTSMNSLVGLSKNKELEKELIDNCVSYWKEEFKPELEKIVKKANDNWKKL